ncbi:MAG: hypothetical protein LC723_03375, partial [Actinobacteria bacterium]|nr:hypothetical protein [Actinomycetota bacterium]
LLTAWLNFANGGIEYPQLFDTNGDHIPDTAFSSLMTTAESVRINPASSTDDLKRQRLMVQKVNGS